LGLFQALDQARVNVGFFKPFQTPGETGPERSTAFLAAVGQHQDFPDPLTFDEAKSFWEPDAGGQSSPSRLIQEIIERFEDYVLMSDKNVVVVEGLQPTNFIPESLNRLIAKALDAEVILVSTMRMGEGDFREFQNRVTRVAEQFGGLDDPSVIGCIVNQFNAPASRYVATKLPLTYRLNFFFPGIDCIQTH
jgi:phosphate acetyltransferase